MSRSEWRIRCTSVSVSSNLLWNIWRLNIHVNHTIAKKIYLAKNVSTANWYKKVVDLCLNWDMVLELIFSQQHIRLFCRKRIFLGDISHSFIHSHHVLCAIFFCFTYYKNLFHLIHQIYLCLSASTAKLLPQTCSFSEAHR